ncbi:hypothetical protein A2334_03395 [Candidatus Roizmanbacteria bacterium RIFOXYB2_FULL_38_10]|uniref:EfeO-type cupredoxin-like domain-containing protein n=1 Tax=Candidatus Roizmanbacteria bacterium RIFOXYD1_FULL_38_12 TaxID=1802093 RepID=A0A1F7L134_9BACT|nr:MAG: hypothetical protein A3K47_03450 [Candidatus Roizmanbacteria bacterium RIFOXYA2_FULL_38_14]OGK63818.1 MAG: hypothetical protein A3K27_03450 [Candidatus Roizmanbacteria bacterium RIFOXYA1_FULL_37_12]OGK65664.1 MAG: hypothetical protein A3K38_03450 [Candidatus Roizmanbacteria bacterium RIFOXYB1_FULL_40_23]OGK67448.1 MAG: hypothetical protein A2334_03395 [Candidatus Roizmanbacteria bacterium RIFOXYB2_FULL_38_10]OGK70069.1 MAG: hypothetical protein A3K21_03455 [Candidatus Roizmanbacteria ba
MNKTYLIIAVVIVLGLIGLWYFNQPSFSTNNESAPAQSSSAPTSSSSFSSPATTEQEMTIVQVEAGSFYYKPSIITVKKGQKVKIVMNSVSLMHDFNIDELSVKMPIIQSGGTGSVEFVPDQVGTFEYYCSVGQHRANGQVGSLIVQE